MIKVCKILGDVGVEAQGKGYIIMQIMNYIKCLVG